MSGRTRLLRSDLCRMLCTNNPPGLRWCGWRRSDWQASARLAAVCVLTVQACSGAEIVRPTRTPAATARVSTSRASLRWGAASAAGQARSLHARLGHPPFSRSNEFTRAVETPPAGRPGGQCLEARWCNCARAWVAARMVARGACRRDIRLCICRQTIPMVMDGIVSLHSTLCGLHSAGLTWSTDLQHCFVR